MPKTISSSGAPLHGELAKLRLSSFQLPSFGPNAGVPRARFEYVMRHGPKEFSWFIYRVTNPTLRDLAEAGISRHVLVDRCGSLGKALATYLRTLLSGNSLYDQANRERANRRAAKIDDVDREISREHGDSEFHEPEWPL